jgi:hypothetical protein
MADAFLSGVAVGGWWSVSEDEGGDGGGDEEDEDRADDHHEWKRHSGAPFGHLAGEVFAS